MNCFYTLFLIAILFFAPVAFAMDSGSDSESVFNLKNVINRSDFDALKKGFERWCGTEEEFVKSYGNPIQIAVEVRKVKMLQYILTTQFGTPKWLNYLDFIGYAPIHYIKKGDKIGLKLLELLLLNGADINLKYTGDGGTLLWKISYDSGGMQVPKLALVKVLIGYGSDKLLTCNNTCLCTPQKRAFKSGFIGIALYLKNTPSLSLIKRYWKASNEIVRKVILSQVVLYSDLSMMRMRNLILSRDELKRVLSLLGKQDNSKEEIIILKKTGLNAYSEKIILCVKNYKFTDVEIGFNPNPTPVEVVVKKSKYRRVEQSDKFKLLLSKFEKK